MMAHTEHHDVVLSLHDNDSSALLSKEEELRCAQEMESTRRTWMRALLCTPFGIKHTTDILHKINQEELNFDKYIRTSEIELAHDELDTPFVKLSASTIKKRMPAVLLELDQCIRKQQWTAAAELALTLSPDPNKILIPIFEKFTNAIDQIDRTPKGKKMIHVRSVLCEPTIHVAKKHHIAVKQAFTEWQKARHRLINGNHGLVGFWANKESGKGMDFEDLCAEGEIGLMRAADKFEWRRGYKFSTFASWWIRQAMQRAIMYNSRTIRIPSNRLDTLRAVNPYLPRFREQYGRDPRDTDADKQRLTDITRLPVADIKNYLHIKLISAMKNIHDPVASSKPTHGKSSKEHSLSEMLSDPDSPRPLDECQSEEVRSAILNCLTTIPVVQRLPFKVQHGIAFLPPEKELVKIIIKYRNHQSLSSKERNILCTYLKQRGTTLEKFPISAFGTAHPPNATDQTYMGSLLMNTVRINRQKSSKNIHPIHIYEGATYILEEVGQIFAVTRERIRQIEEKVFDSLQAPHRKERLRSFISRQ